MSYKIVEKYPWLNNNFFEKALRVKYEDDSIFVKTFDILYEMTKRNQNYWCDVVKTEINYTNSSNVTKSYRVMLKIACYNPYMEESMEKYNPFRRELFFHQELLPKVEELLLSVDDNTKLTEKYVEDIIHNLIRQRVKQMYFRVICIVNERPQPKYLMFEELSQKKFLKGNRKLGLDVNHLKIVMRNLAKLHAASAVLPLETFTYHQQPNISEYFKVFHSLFVNCVQSLVDKLLTEKFDGAEKLAIKLNGFERNMIDKSSEAFMLQADDFGVLCHGDLWLNNLLFEYDDEKVPKDVRMVDFGLSYFGSPGIDLSYLLFTSSSADIKDYEIDILLQFYHQQLHANLIKLDYKLPIPTLIQIHNSFSKCGVIGFMYSCLLLPMRFADSSTVNDLTGLVKQSNEALEFRRQLFGNEKLMNRFKFLLKYFDRKGFLD